ncbi:MAG: mechanosensitive ion channel [Marinomonas sp.]
MQIPYLGTFAIDQDALIEGAIEFGTKAAIVIGILLVTWIVAKIVKWTFTKLVNKIEFLQRDTSGGETVGGSIGKIVSGLVWIFGLIAILNALGLEGPIGPLQELLNTVMGFIPNVIGAGLIFFIGAMVANIVRDIVTTAMQTVNLDKWANKGGVDQVTGNSTISSTIGTVVYVLIIIPVAIAALSALKIEAISGPAISMLNMIMNAIPVVIGAGILLGLGFVISKFAANILTEVLAGLGIDRPVQELGLLPDSTTASSVIGRVVQVAIILFAAVAATKMLGFPELTKIVNTVLALGGKVIFGAVVIGIGFMLANLLAKLVSGASEGGMAGNIVKYATIILFTFMGLNFTGVGEMITQTAFSAIVIGMSVAGALAFGLGGREWAAKQLNKIK